MLVVIGIIAILASMLLPALSKAREKAEAVSCVSNMKQLGIGMTLYIGDHKGRFPFRPWDASSSEEGCAYGWAMINTGVTDDMDRRFPLEEGAMFKYVGERKAFACPSDLLDCPLGYQISNTICALKINQVQPSKMVAFVEETDSPFTKRDGYFDIYFTDYESKTSSSKVTITLSKSNVVDPTHSGRNNFLFVDGHVTSETWSQKEIIENCMKIKKSLAITYLD